MRRDLIILASFAFSVASCDKGDPPAAAGAVASEDAISYRQEASTFVETERLLITGEDDLDFHGFLLDPFSDQRLEVRMDGRAQYDGRVSYSLRSEAGPHLINFSYWFIEPDRIECLIVVESDGETPFKGQWRIEAVGEPK